MRLEKVIENHSGGIMRGRSVNFGLMLLLLGGNVVGLLLPEVYMAQTALQKQQAIAQHIPSVEKLFLEGKSLYKQDKYLLAIEKWLTALKIYNGANPLKESEILSNVSLAYLRLNNAPETVKYAEMAVKRAEGQHDDARSFALLTLGLAYSSYERYPEAVKVSEEALLIAEKGKDFKSRAQILLSLGSIYEAWGKYEKAIQLFEEVRKWGELNDARLLDQAKQHLGYIRHVILNPEHRERKFDESFRQCEISGEKNAEYYQQRAKCFRDLGAKGLELESQAESGFICFDLENYNCALTSFNQALLISQEIGVREREAGIFQKMGIIFARQDNTPLATIFFKKSVSIYESIRASSPSLPDDLKKNYIQRRSQVYRDLADLLLKQNRVLEAQQILDLLKVQELEDYLQNTRSSDEKLIVRPPEEEILRQYGELQKTAIQLGKERAELSALNKNNLSPVQTTRLDQLKQLETAINRQFNQFLDSEPIKTLLAKLSDDTQKQAVDPTVLNGLRDDLKTLNAISLYPLILDDRLELIITTPNNPPVRRIVPVKKETLVKAITDYRSALKRPGNLTETQQLAQQLYDWLIKPIEQDLAQANPQTIIYAPDGALRYIPLATLYDKNQPAGKQWLAQRYQIQNITARSLINNFTTPRKPQLQIFAGAYGSQSKTVEIGSNRFSFSGIPFTLKEVNALGQTFPNTRILTEQAFSKTSTERQLDSFNIIHLATHGKFVVGKAENSFILLGNGDTITLPEIKDLSLANVDLIVLSACETGIGDILGGGEEILGLGYQFQRAGAKAAIASLWQVDDGGTQLLMNAFYKALQQGKTKSQALQIAQNALITSDFKSLGLSRSDIEVTSDRTGQPIPASQLSHPYYWAPFILIGNGL